MNRLGRRCLTAICFSLGTVVLSYLQLDSIEASESVVRPNVTKNIPSNDISFDIPDNIWLKMQNRSWHPKLGCPSRSELAYLRIPFVNFDGIIEVGEMVVAKSAAADVLVIFAELRHAGFRLASMKLVDVFGGDDAASMKANNTSGFNCRKVRGSSRLSEHSFGTAIDINPVQNPYVKGAITDPPSGTPYDSSDERIDGLIGVITLGDVVTVGFAKAGWKWGGSWKTLKDYQHFSLSGR